MTVALAGVDGVRRRPGGRSARIRAQVLTAVREELELTGYAALSHRAVAKRANVDPTTVYRRWPNRPLLVTDALLEVAGAAVPVPDTGALRGDLSAFLQRVVAVLDEPRLLRLFHALSAAGAEAGGELAQVLSTFWEARFAGAGEMVARAAERGECTLDVDPQALIETLVAPAYFRALVTGAPLDGAFVERCVAIAIASVTPAAGGARREGDTEQAALPRARSRR